MFQSPPAIKSIFIMASLLLSAFGFNFNAFANSDCSSVLIPDKTVIQYDVETTTAYLNTINEDNYKSASHNAEYQSSILATGVLFGNDVSYEQFNESRKKYFAEVNLSTSYKNATNFLLTRVSPDAFNAYSKCLQNDALSSNGVHIIPISISDDLATFKLIWNGCGTKSQKIHFDSLVGYEVIASSKLPTEIFSGRERDFSLRRLPNQESSLTITIADSSASFVIPKPPVVTQKPLPKEIFVNPPYKTEGDDRLSARLSCPEKYHVMPETVHCYSTSLSQSGPVVESAKSGAIGWFCRWEKTSPVGVGLVINANCRLDE